jgi:hypothetical protein
MGTAQVNHAEDFVSGDILYYMVCTMPDSPGDAGTAVIWDFSSVQDSGNGQHITWVLDDTAVAGDLVLSPTQYLANAGNRVQKTPTQSFIAAVLGSSVNYTYDAGALWMDRVLSYGLLDSNTFTSILNANATTLNGGGTSHIEVDGSGTVKTPQGTFNNVLRVKRTIDNVDSLNSNSLHNLQVSYLWYDDAHTAPLFRIDSIYRSGTGIFQNTAVTTGTASYLQSIVPANAQQIAAVKTEASGCFNDNDIVVHAQLRQGKLYQVALFDLTGKQLYSNNFTTSGNTWRFNPGIQLPASTYLVVISQPGNNEAPVVIKVLKQ